MLIIRKSTDNIKSMNENLTEEEIIDMHNITRMSPIYIREDHDLSKPCKKCGSATAWRFFGWGVYCDNPDCEDSRK